MTEHDSTLRPVWQWYALAAVLLLLFLALDLTGVLDILGPTRP